MAPRLKSLLCCAVVLPHPKKGNKKKRTTRTKRKAHFVFRTVSLMIGSWTEFVVWLFVFILIVLIVAACIPRTRRWVKTGVSSVIVERPRERAAYLRQQIGSTIVAALPITATAPVAVPFTRPTDTTSYTVPRSGDYRVSYNVQLVWSAASDVGVGVLGVVDSTTQSYLDGSQQQTSGAADTAQNLTANFVVHLKRHTVLTLVVQAQVDGAVVVPASSSATLILPTTLASLCVNEI
jgi:hypothetical protein